MRIETGNRTGNVNRAGAASRSGSGASFAPTGGEAPARAQPAMPISAPAGLAAILALQAVGGPLEGKRRAARKGRTLLDKLEDIKADLLVGRVSGERLDELVALVSEYRERSEPELDAVLDEIELRVHVELAKLGRYAVL